LIHAEGWITGNRLEHLSGGFLVSDISQGGCLVKGTGQDAVPIAAFDGIGSEGGEYAVQVFLSERLRGIGEAIPDFFPGQLLPILEGVGIVDACHQLEARLEQGQEGGYPKTREPAVILKNECGAYPRIVHHFAHECLGPVPALAPVHKDGVESFPIGRPEGMGDPALLLDGVGKRPLLGFDETAIGLVAVDHVENVEKGNAAAQPFKARPFKQAPVEKGGEGFHQLLMAIVAGKAIEGIQP
jgi:hypothetical protein